MLNNKKAFQLSINMIVVIILGLSLMGVGISIFYKAYNKTVDIKESVDSQTQRQLNDLLDTGEAIVVPINNKEGSRGDYVDFDLGISNELGGDKDFYLFVRFGKFINPTGDSFESNQNDIDIASCRIDSDHDSSDCPDNWILMSRTTSEADEGFANDNFELENNERHSVPIRIVLPKRVEYTDGALGGLPDGQYIFNVDVYVKDIPTSCSSDEKIDGMCLNKYFSRKKLYVTV